MALKWYITYLADQTQSYKSNTFAVNDSLPQGSVLGPYTEDLPSVVEEHHVDIYLYADVG